MSDLTKEVIPNVWRALSATAPADLDYWTPAQILQWMDEELKRMARAAAVYVDVNSLEATAASPRIPLPPQTIAVITVAARTPFSKIYELRNQTSMMLDARDSGWAEKTGQITTFTLDHIGVVTPDGYPVGPAPSIRFYPIPNYETTVAITAQNECPALSATVTDTPITSLLDDQLALRAIAEARRNQTDAQMPEVVEWCESVIATYTELSKAYFGMGA